MKCLIVDDESIPRTVLQRMLQGYGSCDTAATKAEAMAAVKQAIDKKEPYRLVCLDIQLPDGSGQEILKGIRGLEEQFDIPSEIQSMVIMISGYSSPEQVKEAFINGSNGFLVKPVDAERLKKRLRELKLINEQ